MPDNLVVNVRQISQYPARNPVDGSDLVLLQAGGLGGPYYAATASAVFTSVGITPGGPFVWGVGAPPAGAGPDQILTGGLSLPSSQAMLFNAYEATAGGDAYWSSGLAGSLAMNASNGMLTWSSAPSGAAGAAIASWTAEMTLSASGHMMLGDTLSVARDPTAALEVATMGYVTAHTVASWNGRSGAVTLTLADITGAGGAPIASPAFTGVPTGPTAAPGTSTTELATTAFVTAAIAAVSPDVHSFNGRNGVVTFLTADFNAATAILTDPVPTAPTAATTDSSQQLATTAFVHAAIAAGAVTSFNGRLGPVTLTAADLTGAGGALLASPAFTGIPNAPTAVPGTSTGQLATTAFVQAAVAASTVGVSSFNTRTGAVVLNQSDIVNANGWASPSFTGVPLAPTAATPTNNTQVATTAFVHAAITAAVTGVTSFNTRTGAVVLTLGDVTGVGGAALASPAFTGTPTANTAAPGTNTTQLATTAFVAAALAAISTGVTSFNGRTGAITLQGNDISAAGGVVSASPAFTGVPTAPTATTGDSSFQLATTQFVAEAIAAGVAGVSTWNGRAGAVTMTIGDITGAGGAPVASPSFTGVPLAPTATAGTSTQQLATTAFVSAALAAFPLVSSFNGRTGAVTLTAADISAAGGAILASVVSSFNSRTGAVVTTAADMISLPGNHVLLFHLDITTPVVTVDLFAGFDGIGTYDELEIHAFDLVGAAQNNLYMLVSADGTTFDTGADYFYNFLHLSGAGTVATPNYSTATSTTFVSFAPQVGTQPQQSFYLIMNVRLAPVARPCALFKLLAFNSQVQGNTDGMWAWSANGNQQARGIRFGITGPTNITRGSFRVFGIKK
jgi:hypothetical protein